MGCHTWFYRKGFKSDKDFPIRRRVKGHWYVEDTKRPKPLNTSLEKSDYYHDLFRIGGYPEKITLHSFKECERFIKSNKIKKVHWKDLREFWNKYPDGMICFG